MKRDVISLLEVFFAGRAKATSLAAGGNQYKSLRPYGKLGCMDGVQVEDLFKVFVSNLIRRQCEALQSVNAGKFPGRCSCSLSSTQGCTSNHGFPGGYRLPLKPP